MKSRIKGIVVTGTGEASAPPDLITLHAGVSALAATVAEANRIAADAATRLIGSLTDSGIDRSDISTSNYTINSEYDWSGNERRFTGFRVNNNIQVHIHDLARSGQILDDAVAAAGDAITVNSLTFSIEDSAQLEEEARKRAWEDARKVAGQLAELAGRPF